MRNVSNDYLAQVQGAGRQFGVSVKVYGNGPEPESLWLGDIISIDILRSCSDQLQIGACMSDKLTLQTKATTLFNGRLKKIEVFYRCTAPVLDWAQLGTFYVDEAVTKQGVTAVTAYDMMSRLDKRVSWVDTSKATAPTFPCKMQTVLNYLCAHAGVSTDFTCEDITIDKAPDGYTARELISYIAASHGRNARFSPSEVLKFPAYEEVGKTVQHGRCYSLDVAGGSGYTVKGILFQLGGDDKVYIDGTASEYDETADGIVTAFDPFATVGIAEYAWNRLGGLNYSAVSLEMPAENVLEPGDVFTVEDADGSQKKAVVMEQELSLSCTGGFVERISCTAESKAQNRSTENRQDAAEKQIAVGSSGTALTEYKYISDNSVKFNGVTYTVEKDADTGLISKISDSSGNEFEPEISAGITDAAVHNAVFWAVAMCRGINSVKIPKPVIELLFDGSLKNTGSGTYTIAPTDNSAEILYAAGINGKCYAAVNYSCIQITDVSSLLLSDFTITFWTKINSNGLSKYPGLRRWCWWVSNDALRGFEVSYSSIYGPSENVPSFVVKGGTQAKQTTKRIDDGEWHSVSIVQRGDFIVATIDNSETISWENCVLTPVGKYMCLSKEDYALNGYISSFRVFDRALDEAVIRQILALK